jgi:hypothetical protein
MTLGEGEGGRHAAVAREDGEAFRPQGGEDGRHVVRACRQKVALRRIAQPEAGALDDEGAPAVGLQATHEIRRQAPAGGEAVHDGRRGCPGRTVVDEGHAASARPRHHPQALAGSPVVQHDLRRACEPAEPRRLGHQAAQVAIAAGAGLGEDHLAIGLHRGQSEPERRGGDLDGLPAPGGDGDPSLRRRQPEGGGDGRGLDRLGPAAQIEQPPDQLRSAPHPRLAAGPRQGVLSRLGRHPDPLSGHAEVRRLEQGGGQVRFAGGEAEGHRRDEGDAWSPRRGEGDQEDAVPGLVQRASRLGHERPFPRGPLSARLDDHGPAPGSRHHPRRAAARRRGCDQRPAVRPGRRLPDKIGERRAGPSEPSVGADDGQ